MEEAEENTSGDGAVRNGPLFGNSLCSAGNARRLSIMSTGNLLCCSGLTERLRANAPTEGTFKSHIAANNGLTLCIWKKNKTT